MEEDPSVVGQNCFGNLPAIEFTPVVEFNISLVAAEGDGCRGLACHDSQRHFGDGLPLQFKAYQPSADYSVTEEGVKETEYRGIRGMGYDGKRIPWNEAFTGPVSVYG
jgi:hypothetical protein